MSSVSCLCGGHELQLPDGSEDLHDLEPIGRKLGGDDVVDLARGVAGPTDLDPNVLRTDANRSRRCGATRSWGIGDRHRQRFAQRTQRGRDPRRQVGGRRQPIPDRCATRQLEIVDASATPREHYDRGLVILAADDGRRGEGVHREPQVPPAGQQRGHRLARRQAKLRVDHLSGLGSSASVTRCRSSWYEPMNARRVRTVGAQVSNSATARPSGW